MKTNSPSNWKEFVVGVSVAVAFTTVAMALPPLNAPDTDVPSVSAPTVKPPVYVVPPAYRYITADRTTLFRVLGRAKLVSEAPQPASDEKQGPVELQEEKPARVEEPQIESPQNEIPQNEIPQNESPQNEIVVIEEDGDSEADYVEYYDQGHYVAELRSQPEEEAQRRVNFTGRIAAKESLEICTQDKPHMILRVRDSAGRNAIVDLGIASQYAETPIELGDAIGVKAHLGTLNGQPVLIAETVRLTDGNSETRVLR